MSPTSLPRRWRQSLGRIRRLWRNREFLDALLLDGQAHFLRFAPPGHFYSPIPQAGIEVAEDGDTDLPGIDLNRAGQVDTIAALAAYYAELPFPEHPVEGHRFHFDNPYFTGGDAVVLYGMLRWLSPARIVEVGSGHSSAAMLDVAERFDLSPRITFIEPYPASLRARLRDADLERHTLVASGVQAAGLDVFEALVADDILFIDSSHVLKTASDVHFLLFEVLPRLAPGVMVHFHDIPWPFDYPPVWLREGRAWNEAYALRAFLQFNDAFEIVCFNAYLALHQRERLATCMPRMLVPSRFDTTLANSSLWLRRRV